MLLHVHVVTDFAQERSSRSGSGVGEHCSGQPARARSLATFQAWPACLPDCIVCPASKILEEGTVTAQPLTGEDTAPVGVKGQINKVCQPIQVVERFLPSLDAPYGMQRILTSES